MYKTNPNLMEITDGHLNSIYLYILRHRKNDLTLTLNPASTKYSRGCCNDVKLPKEGTDREFNIIARFSSNVKWCQWPFHGHFYYMFKITEALQGPHQWPPKDHPARESPTLECLDKSVYYPCPTQHFFCYSNYINTTVRVSSVFQSQSRLLLQ